MQSEEFYQKWNNTQWNATLLNKKVIMLSTVCKCGLRGAMVVDMTLCVQGIAPKAKIAKITSRAAIAAPGACIITAHVYLEELKMYERLVD